MQVTNFKPVENAGALIGKFDVELDSLTIKGMSLFSNNKGGLWIGEPSDKWTDRQGEAHYSKHVIISDAALKTDITSKLKEILFNRDAATGIQEQTPDFDDQEIPF